MEKRIKTYKLSLNSLEKVKEFCNFTPKLDGDIDIKSERYIVDGKSILGLLSLNLAKPLTAIIKSSDDEIELFEEKIKNWLI